MTQPVGNRVGDSYMNLIEAILITIGISLDVFATIECKGAQLSKIQKKPLILLCSLYAVWQVASLCIGTFAGNLLHQHDLAHDSSSTKIIAVAIFGILGLRMIIKGWKNESIVEHLDNVMAWKRIVISLSLTSIATLVVGVALGFLGTSAWALAIIIFCVTVLVVIIGIYVGYHFGYEQKTKAYFIGGVLLMIGALDTMLRYVLLK